jgi:hypothetical protein
MTLRGRLRSFTISSIEWAPTTFAWPLAAFQKFVYLRDGTIEPTPCIMVGHVQDQVLAHDCQADQRDVAVCSMIQLLTGL